MEKETERELEGKVETHGVDDLAKKKTDNTKRVFLKASGITLGIVFCLIMVILIVGKNIFEAIQVDTDYVEYTPKAANHQQDDKVKGEKPKVADKTIMIFGVDKEEARTDTILIAHLDSKTEKVSIVSIPRDTMVVWTEEQIDKAQELERIYQYRGKITDMSSLGGIENLRHFTIRSVEEMLDVKVDNYVVVNTQVIRQMVDALGGIEVNVPRRMEYDDNYQDLHIDLEPGLQVLNGEQAEGLLRWRHNKDYSEQYAMGDLGRIETQQLFLGAFADKVINDMPMTKLVEVATAVYKNVKTDIRFKEIMDYVNYIPYLKIDKITFATLPGESAQIGNLWYYLVDEQALVGFVDEHFYNILSDKDQLLFDETVTHEMTTTRAAYRIN